MSKPANNEKEQRFGFGKNWSDFIKHLSHERIDVARRSLLDMTGVADFSGKSFLDIGSGSGVFSLAALQLGAKVHSFDFDPDSVAATSALKERYAPPDADWSVEQGSVLDAEYMQRLGVFDIVYSWGVLHHTGALWSAMENAAKKVKAGGLFYIALYNDQGFVSRLWTFCKRIYNSGTIGRAAVLTLTFPPITLFQCLRSFAQTGNPFRHHLQHKDRGMSPFHDLLDWVGGYPFETAKPEDVFRFLKGYGFVLENIVTTNGHGNNEFLFRLLILPEQE